MDSGRSQIKEKRRYFEGKFDKKNLTIDFQEIDEIERETKVFWENQVVMKRNYENFTEFGSTLCTELSRVLSDQERFLTRVGLNRKVRRGIRAS